MSKGKGFLLIIVALIIFIIDFINVKDFDGGNDNKLEMIKTLTTDISQKNEMVDISGLALKLINSKMFYMNEGIYITEENNTVNVYPETDAKFEIAEMKYLKSVLDERGINLLYVNAPVKYSDDDYIYNEFGVKSYVNNNADKFVDGLNRESISVLDLRGELFDDNETTLNSFYKTDHHWKIETGVLVADRIAKELNDRGYISISERDDANAYNIDNYSNSFFGEQGRKVSEKLVGKDDISIIYPDFDTDYTYVYGEDTWDGTFNDMVVDYNKDKHGELAYYTYLGPNVNNLKIINNSLKNGKVAILGDSLTNGVAPFLSLDVEEITVLNPRSIINENKNIVEEILKTDCDTLIVMYSEAAIGAYERGESANWSLFYFYTN